VAESCTISSSRSRRPVRKLLDKPSCVRVYMLCCPVQTKRHWDGPIPIPRSPSKMSK